MERDRSIEEAEQHFAQEARKLKLSFELKKLGEKPFQTVTCTLFRNNTEKVSEGGGKGIGKQSELSAKFEALEVFTGQVNCVSSPHERFSLSEIRSLNLPILTSKMFPELLSVDFPRQEEKLPWLSYTRYGSSKCGYLPAICSHPFYPRNPFPDDDFGYSDLYLSATTNGIASGCTRTEALIHAMLEIVERHSLSLFVIETFLKEKPKAPKVIDIQTLPEDLQRMANHITGITGYNLLIYHMPNELDIPVYGAILHHSHLAVPIKGSGASLNPFYAIERALLEALEIYHFDPSNTEGQLALERLKKWPKLKKCVEFDLRAHEKIEVSSDPFLLKFSSTDEYLEEIVSRLHKGHFSIYFHETYASEHLSTVHVVIPEAEEFFAVGIGLVVPIHAKGREALCQP